MVDGGVVKLTSAWFSHWSLVFFLNVTDGWVEEGGGIMREQASDGAQESDGVSCIDGYGYVGRVMADAMQYYSDLRR